MCTVSYLPVRDGFILTSNRDESIDRQSFLPEIHEYKDNKLFYPRDKQVDGSWICISQKRSLCLLNGGFEKHHRKEQYRKSRGIVLKDAAVAPGIDSFVSDNFDQIEPFTIIWVEHFQGFAYEIVWNESALHVQNLDANKNAFWSSSTLYDAEWRGKRKNWFQNEFEDRNNLNPDDIFKFHEFGGENNEFNGLIMSRNGGELRTISISQVVMKNNELTFRYKDLIEGKTIFTRLNEILL